MIRRLWPLILLCAACGADPDDTSEDPPARPCGEGSVQTGHALVALRPRAVMPALPGALVATAPLPHAVLLGGVPVRLLRPLFDAGDGSSVLLLQTPATTQAETLDSVRRIAADPRVLYAEPDLVLSAMGLPNDPLLSYQWGMRQVGMAAAWDLPPGPEAVRVAVLDSGVLPHPDLRPALLGGHDFISAPEVALDGDGRDGDPTDMGTAPHGTHVAGVIAATADNGHGVAGVAGRHPGVHVLPVRVLTQTDGRVRGALSDVVDGIRWAAGLGVPGLERIDAPAQIINLSLGGEGRSRTLAQAIDQVIAAGVLVVAAAGNAGVDAACFSPAGLPQVITVGASTAQGARAGYSNHGPLVDLLAPGGDGTLGMDGEVIAAPDTPGVLSTYHSRERMAFTYSPQVGTSQAAPHVAGALALLRSLGPLTQRDAEALLVRTARQGGGERLLDVGALLRER